MFITIEFYHGEAAYEEDLSGFTFLSVHTNEEDAFQNLRDWNFCFEMPPEKTTLFEALGERLSEEEVERLKCQGYKIPHMEEKTIEEDEKILPFYFQRGVYRLNGYYKTQFYSNPEINRARENGIKGESINMSVYSSLPDWVHISTTYLVQYVVADVDGCHVRRLYPILENLDFI